MTVSPTTQELERIMRAFVSEGSGIASDAVIPGNDNAPAPKGLYATVLQMANAQVGIDAKKYITVDGDDTVIDTKVNGWRIATYSVQFYRTGARDAAKAFRQYAHTPLGELFLQKNNLGWKQSGDVIQLDNKINGKYEERAALEIEVRFNETLTQQVNKIGAVEIGVRESAEEDLESDLTVDDQ